MTDTRRDGAPAGPATNSRAKWAKYAASSMAGTIVGQGSLLVFVAVLDWGWVGANIASVSLGTIPNYLLNRYWTWQKRDRNRLLAEVLPFWGMALAGLVLSTVFVAMAEQRWDAPLVANLSNASAFGLLWVAKFFVLDRLLFADADPGA